MKRACIWCVVLTLTWSFSLSRARSEELSDSARQAEMVAEYMTLAQPGPEHERLVGLSGTWIMETRMWMTPGAEPVVIPGTMSSRMVLEGRFLMSEAESGAGPMKIKSIGMMGFDRRSGNYTTVGFDTWGTYYVTAAGPWDDDRKAMVMSGTDYDAALGHTQEYDFILTPLSQDSYRYEVVFKDEAHTKGGDPFKMVEVLYTRVKE